MNKPDHQRGRKLAEVQPALKFADLFDGHFPGHTMQRMRSPDGQYRYTYVSPGVQETFGLDPQALASKASVQHEWLHDDDRARFVEALERSAETLETLDEEVRIKLPDGGLKWVRSIGHPRRLADGTVIWDGVALDVTDRHEALEALERSLSTARRNESSQSRMASIAARDIARPLQQMKTAIAALTEVCGETGGPAAKLSREELSDRIGQATAAFATLEQILDATLGFLAVEPVVQPALPQSPSATFDPVPRGHLTRRQADVLGHLREGRSNRDIAERLGISEGTVKLHVSAILKALGAQNRTDAVRRATV